MGDSKKPQNQLLKPMRTRLQINIKKFKSILNQERNYESRVIDILKSNTQVDMKSYDPRGKGQNLYKPDTNHAFLESTINASIKKV